MKKVGIIGGGIVGLSVAHKLILKHPNLKVIILDKASVGAHQSSHNSGVLHAGLYYKPGSLKAKLSVCGIRQMKEFCARNNIPHETCGKLVIAKNDSEVPRLKELYNRGQLNGLNNIEFLQKTQDSRNRTLR